jgi:acyl-CoA thioester hydrolase
MPEAWPDIAGKIADGVHVLPVRVYYEDTDFSGAVYHANYLRFCERGRSDCLRLLGLHHHRLQGMGFVVRRMVCDFLRPARIDELLAVETRLVQVTGARIELDQQVVRDGAVLFRGAVTCALIGRDGRPRRLPAEVVVRLRALRRPGPG